MLRSTCLGLLLGAMAACTPAATPTAGQPNQPAAAQPTPAGRTQPTSITADPDVASAFVRAYSRGIHRFKTDEPFAIQAPSKYLQLNDRAVLDDTWKQFNPVFADVPYVNPQGVQNAIETVAQTTTPEAAGATPDRLVDSSFVRQLDENGSYKQLLSGA